MSLTTLRHSLGFPAPIVTKAGKAGELEGDVLRGCTAWSAGFAAAGDEMSQLNPPHLTSLRAVKHTVLSVTLVVINTFDDPYVL